MPSAVPKTVRPTSFVIQLWAVRDKSPLPFLRIMRAFILSQFNYCPLVWIEHWRSDFGTMLLRDNAVTIHIRNLQLLMTETYKTKWELNLTFMKEIFVEKHSTYGLRSCHNPRGVLPNFQYGGVHATISLLTPKY